MDRPEAGPRPGRAVRFGLFGGTFDPPHVGHLIAAQDAVEALGLEALVFVPAGSPPHKGGRAEAPAELRLEMVRAAVGGDPRFRVSDREVRRPGPSYTVDTLREVRGEHPDAELFFLLGADQLAELDTWKDPAEVARLARLAVMARREGTGPAADPAVEVDAVPVPVRRIDVSSTEIRERAARGASLRYLVPEAVLRIIEREGLYEFAASGDPVPDAVERSSRRERPQGRAPAPE